MRSKTLAAIRAAAFPLAACAATALLPAPCAHAQGYPNKPVRLVVPLGVGGSVDALARVLAQKMSDNMGQQAIVENRAGASGNIGTEYVAHSAPDGYTTLFVSITLVVNQSLFAKTGYDPVKDFAPVSLLAQAPMVLDVHPSVPVKNVTEFVALAKQQNGKLNYQSAGKGTNSHLSMELFKYLSGAPITQIAYRGGGQGEMALLAGEVQSGFNGVANAVPQIASGKLKPLGISGNKRVGVLPDLPTIAESGVPGYNFQTWYALLLPAGTPPALVTALREQAVKAMRDPELGKRLSGDGTEIITSTPEQLSAHIASESALWAKVVKGSGVSKD
ncbi:MAG TPA: tripartite tricarboxylate transporter substrate binding protein [Burkholderiales bacterium]|nr:tripartite tricarboxylate transporter substrate binding protein [Burkholderiales bacterium]